MQFIIGLYRGGIKDKIMEFTSQIGQDKWVCEYFNYKKGGYFLDIGANDGVYFSNTLYLEKELGWKGLCVEAGKTPFRKLVKNRTCDCTYVFVSDEEKMVDFKEFIYDKYKRRKKNTVQTVQTIQSLPLAILLKNYEVPKVIDYVSIDVEGFDYQVLLGFPFDKYEVILWTIEHNLYFGSSVQKDNIKNIMFKNGYVFAKENMGDKTNIFEDWYINKKYV